MFILGGDGLPDGSITEYCRSQYFLYYPSKPDIKNLSLFDELD